MKRKWIEREPDFADGVNLRVWLSLYDGSRLMLGNIDEDRGLGEWDERIWRVEVDRGGEYDDCEILLSRVRYKEATAFIRSYRGGHNISLYYPDEDVWEYENDYFQQWGEYMDQEAYEDAKKLVGEAS